MKEHKLTNIGRDKNPDLRGYSWRRLTPHLQQSKLDYIIIGEYIKTHHAVSKVEMIGPGILSDHSIVSAEFNFFSSDRGSGLLRFRNKLLKDTIFVGLVKTELGKAKRGQELHNNLYDYGILLELLSSQIRVASIERWKERETAKREENNRILELLDKAESEIVMYGDDCLIERYRQLQVRADEIQEEKVKLAMIYPGAKWLEQGDPPTRYILNLHNRRNMDKKAAIGKW